MAKSLETVIREMYLPEAGRPRGAPHIENIRFWDLSANELKGIMGDCADAMKANPDNPKNIHGPGNYADQINDAASVLYWRKKKGIKEETEELTESLDEKAVPMKYGISGPDGRVKTQDGKGIQFFKDKNEATKAARAMGSQYKVYAQAASIDEAKNKKPSEYKERGVDADELKVMRDKLMKKHKGDTDKAETELAKIVGKKVKKEELELNERELTPDEEKKKEEIVKSMKKKGGEFKKNYGDDAKNVMYATATKMAKEDLDESDKNKDKKQPNPMAKDLRSGKYSKRVVQDKTKYNRKEKHKASMEQVTEDIKDSWMRYHELISEAKTDEVQKMIQKFGVSPGPANTIAMEIFQQIHKNGSVDVKSSREFMAKYGMIPSEINKVIAKAKTVSEQLDKFDELIETYDKIVRLVNLAKSIEKLEGNEDD